MNRDVLRILDANLNRCREGLRVCEELARFVLEDKALSAELKKIRHQSRLAALKIPGSKHFLDARDSAQDLGRPAQKIEMNRKTLADVYLANIQRAKESLRVLEEFSKLTGKSTAPAAFKNLRFKVYDLEKKSGPRLEALRHHPKKQS